MSFIGKLIERVVLNRLNTHMSSNNLHSDYQHGYKKNHGTETLLLKFIDEILVAIDKKLGVVVLIVDLSAAFDTVSHHVLLNILSTELGISGVALKWFKSFLIGRSQQVHINGETSEPIILTCGVPQGSVLGPALFNIYCRSMYKVFKDCDFKPLSYADDNSGMVSFSSTFQYHTLVNKIPQCLEHIQTWTTNHLLKLNATKTEIIVFADSKFLSKLKIHGIFSLAGECIRFLSSVKYLGVTLDSLLTFNEHINSVTSSCYLYIRKIKSIRHLLSKDETQTLVHAFISSRLDCNNSLYVGLTKANLKKLQKVQNTAIRLICKKRTSDHINDCFKQLHWLNIEQRIKFKVLLITFKCIDGSAPTLLRNSIIERNSNLMTLKINQFSSSKTGDRAFSYYAPRYWNELPKYIRTIKNIDNFKSSLKSYLLN